MQENIHKRKIIWRNVIILSYVHAVAIYSAINISQCKWQVSLFAFFIANLAAIGITAGAHRLWTHKSYKAKLPLKIILLIFQTLSFQQCIYDWARDHRVHHKYTDTDADPHNSKKGFFFSHIGWLLVNKHPEVINKGKNIDMTDLQNDPLVMWQKKHCNWFLPVVGFLVPVWLSAILFDEQWFHAWNAQCFRYVVGLNLTWLLNSGAHKWGAKPYDKNISPTDTLIMGITCFGEGWHNYHHVFPWDYKTSELSNYGYNFTIAFIDFFAKIGWAYDLKTVSEETIRKRMIRTGDGSNQYSNIKNIYSKEINDSNNNCQPDHKTFDNKFSKNIWGWDDKDLDEEDKLFVHIYNQENKQ
ncbi:acyl-CoA Delta-9 desaturase-like [Culicoides brevitarsis]|uniref:acyl-CoA Delta-9 desaturase-like n=1 Tax=Culicoides brevitarsis TaxID=469753 RepID=UPI00307C2343